MNICLPQSIKDKVKSALKGKDITISKLMDMSTEQRIELFKKLGIENAKEVNALFESKLILKNKYIGIRNWIDKIAGIGKYSEAKKAELLKAAEEWRKQQEEMILGGVEGGEPLLGLAEKLVGTSITKEQATEVLKLGRVVNETFKEYNPDTKTWSSEQAKRDYGSARVAYEDYIENLKTDKRSLREMLRDRLAEYKAGFKEAPVKSTSDLMIDFLKFISENSISVVASFDNSFMGRQGLKTLMTKPSIWWKEDVLGSFSDIVKTLGGKNARDAMWSDIYTRDNYLNGYYKKAKIIPEWEEQYPIKFPERIPILGRFFKASEQAFTGSAIKSRTALFDFWLDKAKNQGVEINDKVIKDIGQLVNSLTARGQWGKRGEPAIVRLFLWAPKMLKGNIDVLTAMQFTDVGTFARRQAAENLAKIIGTTALTMMVANSIKPGSAETDPRSTNFGKIKAGNTTFDITGGAASIITLALRIASNSYKSSTTGDIVKYGTGYADQTRLDAIINFLTGKTAPLPRLLIDLAKGQDFRGKPVTPASALMSLTTPIAIQNVINLKDNNSADAVLGSILDALGINATTYEPGKDWTISPGKELQAFRERVGDDKFKEANKKYNQEYLNWYAAVKQDIRFQQLTDDQKKQIVENKKENLKNKIMRQYGFIYKRQKPSKLPKL